MGQAGRRGRSGEQRQEPARRDQGLPARSGAGAQVMAKGAGEADSKQPLLALRIAPAPMVQRLIGVGGLAVVVLLWGLATMGEAEQRLISPALLPSPAEVVKSFPSLLHERALLQSIA